MNRCYGPFTMVSRYNYSDHYTRRLVVCIEPLGLIVGISDWIIGYINSYSFDAGEFMYYNVKLDRWIVVEMVKDNMYLMRRFNSLWRRSEKTAKG